MRAPDMVYEHGSTEVDQKEGPLGLISALDECSRDGWECFQVMPMTQKSPEGIVSQRFVLLLRKKKMNLVLPGPKGVC